MDYGLGISHGGHLAGNLAGLLMWRFWVVKMPAKKLLGKSVDDLMNMRKALFKNGGMLKTK